MLTLVQSIHVTQCKVPEWTRWNKNRMYKENIAVDQ